MKKHSTSKQQVGNKFQALFFWFTVAKTVSNIGA